MAARAKIPALLTILSITGPHDEDKIVGTLVSGANDYLLRLVRGDDLITRVSGLLRQGYPTQVAGEKLTFGLYSFESGIDRVAIAGRTVDLTEKVFEPRLLFFRNLGQPISRTTIIDSVWKGVIPGGLITS